MGMWMRASHERTFISFIAHLDETNNSRNFFCFYYLPNNNKKMRQPNNVDFHVCILL